MSDSHTTDMAGMAVQLKRWALDLGFQAVGITDTELGQHNQHLQQWLADGRHGEMHWMQKHAHLRQKPAELHADTIRVICVRMDYMTNEATAPEALLDQPDKAAVSRYAIGRDYHKVLRGRLAKLARRIHKAAGGRHRAFVDSAPVMEKALAEKAGLGWIGKHTNLLHENAGGWFFLGEIYTSLPLPIDQPATNHCGNCQRCIDVCPTQAITGPYQLDARRCISYLTIEHQSAIPEALRKSIGNRIYGCDDCISVCPWNKFARHSEEPDFTPRKQLDAPTLLALFAWDEATFLQQTEGTAIRRIGHERWLRNLAVALGNAPFDPLIIDALKQRQPQASTLVKEHIEWAIQQQEQQQDMLSCMA